LTPLPELGDLRDAVYFGDVKKHITWDYLKALTPLALSVWYMDDASFALRSKGLQTRTVGGSGRAEIGVDSLSPGSLQRLIEYLRDTHGVDSRLRSRGPRNQQVLQLTTAGTARFQEIVAPYVHPSMAYKLLERFRCQFDVTAEFVPPRQVLVPARVLDVHVKPETRSMHRF